MTTTSTSSDDDDNESQLNNIVGYLKLKTRPKQKFISYLNSINTSRKNIIKGLKYAYINISSASDIIDLIITHSLSLSLSSTSSTVTTTSINELSHFYLINDILFNSMNTSIQHAWIYHDIIKDKLPYLFHMKFHNKHNANVVQLKMKLMQLLNVWNEFKLFEEQFLNGLMCYVGGFTWSDVIKGAFEMKVKQQVDEYQNELIGIYMGSNETTLSVIAKENGVWNKAPYSEMIEMLIKVKEYELYKGYVKECDGEECDEDVVDMKIAKLKEVLAIMKDGFKKVNMFDVDGVPIQKEEYEFFDIHDNNNDDNNNNITNNVDDDDLDGEPI